MEALIKFLEKHREMKAKGRLSREWKERSGDSVWPTFQTFVVKGRKEWVLMEKQVESRKSCFILRCKK